MYAPHVCMHACRRLAGRVQSAMTLSQMAAIGIAALALLVDAGFSVAATPNQVIYGGPVEFSTQDSFAAAEAAASALPQIADEEELVDEPATIIIVQDGAVAAETFFGQGSQAGLREGGLRVHVVRAGETLYAIAAQYGVSERALAKANQFAGSTLIVGDELVIPETTTTATAPAIRRAGGYLPAGFIWPFAGKGIPPHGAEHGKWRALDFPQPIGTPVIAVAAGVVIDARDGWNGGYGNRVIIDHGNAKTVYAHLSAILAVEGQRVSQGETIGLVGNTGRSTGPHLHLEIR